MILFAMMPLFFLWDLSELDNSRVWCWVWIGSFI